MNILSSWVLVIGAIVFSFSSNGQSVDKINKKQARVFKGKIVFNDDTELNCEFTYNPLIPEGLIFVKTDSTTAVYGVTQVKTFSFFDEENKEERFFYNLPLHDRDGGSPIGRYFFELIHADPHVSILGRFVVRVKGKPSLVHGYKRKKVFDLYEKYLFDHRDHTIYRMTKKDILRITADKRNDVEDFVHVNKLTLNENDYDAYVLVIRYYSSLLTY